jgi:hypothetical protein
VDELCGRPPRGGGTVPPASDAGREIAAGASLQHLFGVYWAFEPGWKARQNELT